MNVSQKTPCDNLFKFIKTKIQYFGDQSSLHGVRHVFSLSYMHVFKRFFWFVMLVLCCYGASGILLAALGLYTAGAVSYTVETNYLTWDTAFPAVTVCEQGEHARIKSYLTQHNQSSFLNFYKDIVFLNVKVCRACTNCRLKETCTDDYQQAVENIRLKCDRLLTQCYWDGKPFNCCDSKAYMEHLTSLYSRRNGEVSFNKYGTCFVFNSHLAGNESVLYVNRQTGLPHLVFYAIEGVSLRIHSPYDVVSVGLENILGVDSSLPLVTDFEAIFKAEQTISDISVHSITGPLRGCLFKNELPPFVENWPFGSYTYSACVYYCRAMQQRDACNCTHMFMPKIGNTPVCGVAGLVCLTKAKDTSANQACMCPMSCEDIEYKVLHVFHNRYKTLLPDETIRRSRGIVRLAQLPALRVRRFAIRDLMALVVDIGGVGGVFFGASLLSVIEIIYLFCIRRVPKP